MISEFPQPQRLPHPVRLTEQAWPEGAVPVVSIKCITYQHVNFIRDAIEGFLMQETTFPVEILIHDDASTDGTADIVRQYQAKYPQLIRTVLQTENQHSQGTKLAKFLNPLLRGEFIALCEGDDYWTSRDKLQKQYDFLEAHSDFVVTGHDCFVVDGAGTQIADSLIPSEAQRDADPEELIRTKLWISTATVMHRNLLTECPVERDLSLHGDSWLFSLLGHHGKYHFHHDIAPSCYRRHGGGIWSQQSKQVQQAEWCNSMYWLYRYYQRTGQQRYADHFLEMHTNGCLDMADTQRLFKAAWHRATSSLTWGGVLKKLVGGGN